MRVQQWMSPHTITVSPEADAAATLHEMRKKKVRRFPVMDQGMLVGIITQSDLHTALGRHGSKVRRPPPAEKFRVGELMTRNPATIAPEASLEEAAAAMYKLRISGLPVVAGQELVGIITETDMFRAFVIILGFTGPGGVIEFELDKPDHLLSQLRDRTAGMIVRNMVVFQDPRNGKFEVRMKVRGREELPTKRAPK